jgi:alpha-N-arabinofuranosidase
MKTILVACLTALTFVTITRAAEFHVAVNGNDGNPGTQTAPFRTIQHAANLAQPGDVITVHEGVYRERINPPRGGESDANRIVYQAAPGEKVEIKGSEIAKGWVKVQNDTWKLTLANAFFGGFNPYSDLIHGDWFNPKGRNHHTGAVYLDGEWLTEAATWDEVMAPLGSNALWFGEVDEKNTTLWAQFKGVDPNQQRVEINVRQTVFYPQKAGINYITVRGFTLEDAATPWAPPTAEQIGLIGPHWSKGWIIENNTVRYSTCSGIALGKYGDEWDNKSANSAEGYVKTIERALANGWSKENIGHHIVRNNTISHCEQAGIVGSLGAAFSIVTGNTIHDIHVRQLFSGAEMAGIKFHGAIDMEISHNHIYHTVRGLWLDWMAQGTHISGNLFHDNQQDLFVEVDHGPFLVDNNLFLSQPSKSIDDNSQGGAYVHNLFAGPLRLNVYDRRQTPFLKAHSTEVAGLHVSNNGDDRFYNNMFVQPAGLSTYDQAMLPLWLDGNVFLKGAQPAMAEKDPLVKPDYDPAIKLVEESRALYIEMKFDPAWATERTRQLVTTKLLGRAVVPDLPYEQPDGKAISINTDYFGRSRNESNPSPGPFENPGGGKVKLKVW